jgi:hypothetical protein
MSTLERLQHASTLTTVTNMGSAPAYVSALVLVVNCFQMLDQRRFHGGPEHGDAVLGALAVPDYDLVRLEVDVLNAEACPLQQA